MTSAVVVPMTICLAIGGFGLVTAMTEGPRKTISYLLDHGGIHERLYLDEGEIESWYPEYNGTMCVVWDSEIKDLSIATDHLRRAGGFKVWPAVYQRGYIYTNGPVRWHFGSRSRTTGYIDIRAGKMTSELCRKREPRHWIK